MGIITTQILGFGSPKPKPGQAADPKPVRGFNYAGQPMKDGEYYNGRPEHMEPEAEPREVKPPGLYERTPEYKEKARARAYAQHAKERATGLPSGEGWAQLKKKKGKRWHWTAEMRERARERWSARKAEQEMKKANPENAG